MYCHKEIFDFILWHFVSMKWTISWEVRVNTDYIFCEHIQITNLNMCAKNHVKFLSKSEDIKKILLKPACLQTGNVTPPGRVKFWSGETLLYVSVRNARNRFLLMNGSFPHRSFKLTGIREIRGSQGTIPNILVCYFVADHILQPVIFLESLATIPLYNFIILP